MADTIKFSTSKAVAQRIYPDRVAVDLAKRTVSISGDRVTAIQCLKAAGDLRLELTRAQIVQIELSPIVAFGKPYDFVRRRKESPVRPIVAAFEVGFDLLVDDIAHLAAGRICDTQCCALVISRRRNERELRVVGAPQDISEGTVTFDVIAKR